MGVCKGTVRNGVVAWLLMNDIINHHFLHHSRVEFPQILRNPTWKIN